CYALAPPLRKVRPHPFVVANHVVRASYVSCESALAHHGMIPEPVPVTTSVTTRRPGSWDTPLGRHTYQHIQTGFFHGYQLIEVDRDQHAFIATPEKALLDLLYLRTGRDSPAFLAELRLQNLERLSLDELGRLAERRGVPKLTRAVGVVAELARSEAEEYVAL
ncbi:MAG: type IV toxin-antitoxin system AbiEi family antitoxin domain-containing protein, partial [Chloroflexota bacterium]